MSQPAHQEMGEATSTMSTVPSTGIDNSGDSLTFCTAKASCILIGGMNSPSDFQAFDFEFWLS